MSKYVYYYISKCLVLYLRVLFELQSGWLNYLLPLCNSICCCFKLFSYEPSCDDAALVCRDHVLDVDEGIISSVLFKNFESLLDKITQVSLLTLGIINVISYIRVPSLEKVHNWQNLSVVGD
jgi:hypothetical protein